MTQRPFLGQPNVASLSASGRRRVKNLTLRNVSMCGTSLEIALS